MIAAIIPSYRMKRGHPLLIDRALCPDVLSLSETATLRDFVGSHERYIRYVEVETESVLKDVDTADEYREVMHRREAQMKS